MSSKKEKKAAGSGDGDGKRKAAHADEEKPEERGGTLAIIWEQIGTLVVAVAIALTIRAFLVEPFRIPSGSMLPTLLIGDHLFVNKFIYGPRIPFTEYRLPGLREPHRGDVVVFEVGKGDGRRVPHIVPADKYPTAPREDFVKRVVGLPGDRISVLNEKIWVNGKPAAMIDTGLIHTDDDGRKLQVHTENLVDCAHSVLDDKFMRAPDKENVVVPEGGYFLMGDNRDPSNDSRRWGTVLLQEFKGPAFILYWSWNVNGNALQFFNPLNWWRAEKRWERVFQRVGCDSPAEAIEASGHDASAAAGQG